MAALATVLDRPRGAARSASASSRPIVPSPFAASLQFGFVMDWLYGDDTPRAEQRAALLSLDRALLDEVMGSEGADPETTEAIDEVLAIRRGTAREPARAERRRARGARSTAPATSRSRRLGTASPTLHGGR